VNKKWLDKLSKIVKYQLAEQYLKRRRWLMKKIIAIMVFCLMLFSLFQGVTRVNSSNTDEAYKWIPINNGLYGGDIYSFAFDPANTQIVYAGTWGGGVYKSIDGGINWAQIDSGLMNNSVPCLAVDKTNTQIVYAGTWGNGAYESNDGGTN